MHSPSRLTGLVTLLALLVIPPASVRAQPPARLSSDVHGSWTRGGAEVGWVRLEDRPSRIVPDAGQLVVAGTGDAMRMPGVTFRFGLKAFEGKAGELPAFWFTPRKGAALIKLAKPAQAFGLQLGQGVTDDDLLGISEFTNLAVLSLGGTGVTDKGLKHLKGLKNLRALELGVTKVTNAGLKHLVHLPNLRSLNLGGTKVTDAGLKELATLTQLEYLILGWTKVSDRGLPALSTLANLKSLNLVDTTVTTLASLAPLEKLEVLSLRFSRVTDDGIKSLRPFKSLKYLELLETEVTTDALKALSGKQLLHLEIPFQLRTDAGLADYVAAIDSPVELNLHSWSLTDEGLKHLKDLNRLVILDMRDTKVSDAGLKQLAGRAFHELMIPQAARTDLGLKHYLAAIAPSDNLDLFSWRISDEGLKELAKLKGLKHLDLQRTGVTDKGLKLLVPHLKTLEQLSLKDTAVTKAGVTELYDLSPRKFPQFVIFFP